MIDYTEMIVRLGAAALFGGLLGMNRELHGKPTGVRTFGLVGLGAALVVMASVDFAPAGVRDWNAVSRAIQGVITGIGFLGAGVIIRHRGAQVHGLTTAACIWLTACIGIVCGIGSWQVALVALSIAFFLLTLGGRIDNFIQSRWAKSDSAKEKISESGPRT